MDQKLLLSEALAFLHLVDSSSSQDLKNSYHKLAKKYHPDTGEYDSDILFQELQKHYDFLTLWWSENGSFRMSNLSTNKGSSRKKEKQESVQRKDSGEPIFALYKEAKDLETKAILDYFEKTKNAPLNLDESKNKAVSALRKALEPVLAKYHEIVHLYPQSIWASDSKDSIQRLSVWWKKES